MGNQMKHPAGNFCWFELGTNNQSAAKEFYTGLFGWNVEDTPLPPEMGGVYTMFRVGDKEIGACYQLSSQQAGVPPHWMPYVAVDNVDDTAAKVSSLGGQVIVPPMDVMGIGRLVVFQDPTGASLSVWQPIVHFGADLVGAPGSACWCELATRDTATAKGFYKELFGWKSKDSELMEYTEWINGEQPIGGMMPMDGPQFEGVPPNWLTYFTVEDCDASAAKAQSLGGKLIVPPTDIPNTGRFTVIQDPQGAVFAVFKLTMMQ